MNPCYILFLFVTMYVITTVVIDQKKTNIVTNLCYDQRMKLNSCFDNSYVDTYPNSMNHMCSYEFNKYVECKINIYKIMNKPE